MSQLGDSEVALYCYKLMLETTEQLHSIWYQPLWKCSSSLHIEAFVPPMDDDVHKKSIHYHIKNINKHHYYEVHTQEWSCAALIVLIRSNVLRRLYPNLYVFNKPEASTPVGKQVSLSSIYMKRKHTAYNRKWLFAVYINRSATIMSTLDNLVDIL